MEKVEHRNFLRRYIQRRKVYSFFSAISRLIYIAAVEACPYERRVSQSARGNPEKDPKGTPVIRALFCLHVGDQWFDFIYFFLWSFDELLPSRVEVLQVEKVEHRNFLPKVHSTTSVVQILLVPLFSVCLIVFHLFCHDPANVLGTWTVWIAATQGPQPTP